MARDIAGWPSEQEHGMNQRCKVLNTPITALLLHVFVACVGLTCNSDLTLLVRIPVVPEDDDVVLKRVATNGPRV